MEDVNLVIDPCLNEGIASQNKKLHEKYYYLNHFECQERKLFFLFMIFNTSASMSQLLSTSDTGNTNVYALNSIQMKVKSVACEFQ